MRGFADGVVASLRRVAEERGVAQRRLRLPAPFPWVPGEVLYETRLKDPEELAFLARGRGIPCHLEMCLGVLLDKDSHLPLVDRGHGVRLIGRELDAPGGRRPFEF